MTYRVESFDNGCFFVKSCTPVNVDEPDSVDTNSNKQMLSKIVSRLESAKTANLVISVHGFNTPKEKAYSRFQNECKLIQADTTISSDTIFIGFSWPSERMFFGPLPSAWSSAPIPLRFLLFVGMLMFGLGLYYNDLIQYSFLLEKVEKSIFLSVGAFIFSIPFMFFLLRIAVYFRDGYRATQYGVPDLVDLIRDIDYVIRNSHWKKSEHRIGLSFIAHSMGAYVVTSSVRILSDVFSNAAMTKVHANEISYIGNSFYLQNLVFVSPDIPAEALMPNSANFLRSSLRRFSEVYLFSNKGDEVLHSVSVSANYFSFPTSHRWFGYRLGNVSVNKGYGLLSSSNWELSDVQLGPNSIEELSKKLNGFIDKEWPSKVRYFDCTDCIDNQGKGVLTTATMCNPFIGDFISHLTQLLLYIFGVIDCHGGYFQFDDLSRLIYRLACLGAVATKQVYDEEGESVSTLCQRIQVKALDQ